jgi:hypothetical protein
MMPLFSRQCATLKSASIPFLDGADLEARPVRLTRGTGLQDLKRWHRWVDLGRHDYVNCGSLGPSRKEEPPQPRGRRYVGGDDVV